MAIEGKFSKTGLALLMFAIGFFIGLLIGFIGAYHGSNYWYKELRKENKHLQQQLIDMNNERIKELERALRIYQGEVEELFPEQEKER